MVYYNILSNCVLIPIRERENEVKNEVINRVVWSDVHVFEKKLYNIYLLL